MNFLVELFYYLVFAALVIVPFTLLFFSIQSLRQNKPVPPNKRKQVRAVRIFATSLSLLYACTMLYPVGAYFLGTYRTPPNPINSWTPSPEALMVLSMGTLGFFGLIFLGSIISACLLTIRSLENPKK